MYSRKIVRTVPSPAATSLPRSEPRDSVTLPPDYTGIAFPTGGNSSSGIVRDYPETAIDPPDFSQDAQEENLPEELPSDESLTEEIAVPALAEEIDAPAPAEEEQGQDDALLSSASESQEQEIPAFAEETLPPPPNAHSFAQEEPPLKPLLNPEVLRSLTLEDLLLLWMLLLLLCSEREDQIYLLLGLLLFTER